MTLPDGAVKQTENLEKNFKEYEKCRLSPLYFLATYVQIENPSSEDTKTTQWQPWPYLIDLLDTIEQNKEVVILKARQLGISWLMCGYALWTALFNEHSNILLVSKGEDEAWELIRKIQFIFKRLPSFLQRRMEKDRRDFIDFPDINSRIKALPSTSTAGSGYTASLVIRDELDKHKDAEQSLAALGPTIDAGGRMIDLGSRDYTIAKEMSHLIDRYLKAKNGEIRAKAVFLGWRLRPMREEGLTLDQWFNDVICKKYSPAQVEKEYPETEEQALSESQATNYFDKEGRDFIRYNDCTLPIISRDYDGMVRIWKNPVPGLKYCAFLDPSDGSDPHAAGWMDVVTGEVVAISHGKCSAEKCAEIFDKYCRFYNNAFNEFELNNHAGQKVAETLLRLNTPNRRISVVGRDRANKYGWWTGDGQSNKGSKPLMLETLWSAVKNKSLRVHYLEVANELDSMMRLNDNEIRVPSGKHDDLIMMLGGLLCIKGGAKSPSATIQFNSFQRAATTYA